MRAPLIAPSILSADFLHLGKDVEMINASEADWFHVDVMDGLFVPNISFGFPILKALKPLAQKPLDVHLMIVNPDRYIDEFCEQGAASLSVHYEACNHLHRSLQSIRKKGVKAGVAINPHTPVELLEDIIQDTDLVCMMSVNPGFGGQKFIERTFDKVKRLKDIILKANASTLIEIDGGVDFVNAQQLLNCGADVLVAGNTVFSAPVPQEAIKKLKEFATSKV
jgi:ribulose-phosphate 3-epimerase